MENSLLPVKAMRLALYITIIATQVQDASSAERLVIRITDKVSQLPVACRIHLKDAQNKPVRPANMVSWHEHFVCPGNAELSLPAGMYTYVVERGPEYQSYTGSVSIDKEGPDAKLEVALERLVEMKAEGWWSGELHVHRPIEHMALLMDAEDLHVAPTITWWNKRNQWNDRELPADPLIRIGTDRYCHVLAGEDERGGGALLYFGLKKPLAIAEAEREYPSSLKFAREARRDPSVWIDIEKPFWQDVPLWLALERIDSIGLANNHMCRASMYESEAWGRPRDTERLPSPRGNGFWTQEIYYQLLNCGFRIPPSAGSASGVLPNPVGYNRVYVHLGPELSYAAWWEGLRQGRSFVTNGPLLRVKASGQLPGHKFTAEAGATVGIDLTAQISTRDPIRNVEVIVNGRVERTVPYEEFAATGKLGRISFTSSGWFLVRAITENLETFRFASTAPYYVEIGDKPQRISRESAAFFLEWTRERTTQLKLDDPNQRAEVLADHSLADKFWRDRLAQANAD